MTRLPGTSLLLTFLLIGFNSVVHAANYSAILEGGQEVPPVVTANSGNCTFTLNGAETQLSIQCTHTINPGFVTAGHIHFAPAGLNGPVAFALASATSPINETWIFNGTACSGGPCLPELKASNLYVNVHTTSNAPGEIRGQIQAITPPQPVPSITVWGLGILAGLLGLIGIRKRRK